MSLPLLQTGEIFADQVTNASLTQNLVYATGTVGAIVVLAGLLMIDAGGLRRRNIANATVEKLVGFFIGFSIYFLIGFAFWNWQYNQAFEVEQPLWTSIQDFWMGGALANEYAQNVDPEVFPGLNNFQIFIFFLACFAGLINVLFHFAVSEKMKAGAYFVVAAVAAVVSSVLSWATWGSVGPLTNAGFHDFFGVGFVYMFPAGMALVFLKMLKSRPGMFDPHPKVSEYRTTNQGLVITGVAFVFSGLPMVILSCLFFFDPEALAVSVTMAETSLAIAFNNYGLAWAGGTLMGAVIAYRTRHIGYVAVGAFSGYVAGASGMDVWKPWQMFLVALGAPIVAYLVQSLLYKRKIDEHKLIPIFIGAGSYGMIMVGIFKWGTPRSGYLGIEEGAYAFQHAEINLIWQVIGIVVCIGVGVITAAILGPILKATIGLERSQDEQAEGLDRVLWHLEVEVQPAAETASSEAKVPVGD